MRVEVPATAASCRACIGANVVAAVILVAMGCGNGALHVAPQADSGLWEDGSTVADGGPADTRRQPDTSGDGGDAGNQADAHDHADARVDLQADARADFDAEVARDAGPSPDSRPNPDAGDPPPPVNVVLVILDDLGWTDLGSYGSSFYETPSIDQLAAEGTRLTQFYASAPLCSPMRASLMTGKHPARLNLTDYIGHKNRSGKLLPANTIDRLPLDETTLGEAFKAGGYTTGYIGKWHLGTTGFMPENQGFDFTLAVNHSGAPGSYFYPYRSQNGRPDRDVPDLGGGIPGEYLTDRLTDEALDFLQRKRDKPFLLVLSHYAVHIPLQSKKHLTDKYTAKAAKLPPLGGPPTLPEGSLGYTKQRQDHPVYAGMVQSADRSVGRVMSKLRELKLDSRTVVVLVSDNGGLSTYRTGSTAMPPTSVLPLRAGKGFVYEGGIRVPLIVKWPGVTPKGQRIHTPATTMDLYPTLLQMAGLAQRPNQHRDGVSLASLLRDNGKPSREALHWHYPHYGNTGTTPVGAIRAGNHKLIEWYEDNTVELYDLAQDIGESKNLAQKMPNKTNELRNLLHQWRTRVDAQMPKPQ